MPSSRAAVDTDVGQLRNAVITFSWLALGMNHMTCVLPGHRHRRLLKSHAVTGTKVEATHWSIALPRAYRKREDKNRPTSSMPAPRSVSARTGIVEDLQQC
ncbi:hypothetical protein MRB53_041349 [Persea americana]|nr:hypothetical protein MRB53_041349 [Persea americana]